MYHPDQTNQQVYYPFRSNDSGNSSGSSWASSNHTGSSNSVHSNRSLSAALRGEYASGHPNVVHTYDSNPAISVSSPLPSPPLYMQGVPQHQMQHQHQLQPQQLHQQQQHHQLQQPQQPPPVYHQTQQPMSYPMYPTTSQPSSVPIYVSHSPQVQPASPSHMMSPTPSSPPVDQPPVPLSSTRSEPPTPASIAAEQAAAAQAALRQAQQNARVAQIHANALSGKLSAGGQSQGQDGHAQTPRVEGTGETEEKVRKSAGKYALKDFQVERTLGTGSFGRVHLVKSRHNGRFYAVKVLGKEKVVRMKQVEHTNSEREMLVRVRHPFLVNLWGTFSDPRNLYMVMDFVAGGELFSLLRKSQRFPNSVAKFYAAEVALAIDYLHSLDIIYRDLKPENILLGADGHVKVTDFGFAKYVPDITWTLCGTPDYLAPEVVQSKGYNKSVDWYALGVLIFEMLAGYPPFFTEDGNPMKLYEKIIAGKVRYPAYFDELSKDLLKSLLISDLTKRFGNLKSGSHDVFGHGWFAEVDWNRLYRRDIPAPYVPKIEGDGDTSQFDRYAECDTSEYGKPGPDPHGSLFPHF
ncbi:agc pka protein kinase [Phaffia rhodozyma]|uniref:cAMP-dependent protein kinase n=1 Tax=Phaffia rhodozyma TaxID=264483 RepID=A0A0F7SQ66_PHARH|nr:agc pka protein kinase [Phaffia rhodozyma]